MHSKADNHCSLQHREGNLGSQKAPDRAERLVMDILAPDILHIPVVEELDRAVLVVNAHFHTPVVEGMDKVYKQAERVAHPMDRQEANPSHAHDKGFADWQVVVLQQATKLRVKD